MSDEKAWIRQYRAALDESDPGRRLTRIEEAERALKQALRRTVENVDSDQRRTISEALHHLTLVRKDVEEEQTGRVRKN